MNKIGERPNVWVSLTGRLYPVATILVAWRVEGGDLGHTWWCSESLINLGEFGTLYVRVPGVKLKSGACQVCILPV